MKKLLRNESGYSILLVFFIMIIVSVLSLALLNMSTQSLSLSTHEREDQSIFYIAESGLTYEKEQINDLIRSAYNKTKEEHRITKKEDRKEDTYYQNLYVNEIMNSLTNNYPSKFNSFESQYTIQPEAEIDVTIGSLDPLTIDMTSTGYFIENTSNKRKVSQSLTVSMDLKFLTEIEEEGTDGGDVGLPNLAVQAKNDITLSGSATVNGSAATSEGKIIFGNGGGGTDITGKIGSKYKPIAADWFIQQKKIMDRYVIPDLQEIQLPPFPEDLMNSLSLLTPQPDVIAKTQTITLTKDTKIKNINLETDSGLGTDTIIDIGSNTINLYVDSLKIAAENKLKISGSGTLNIFVKDTFTVNGSGSIDTGGNPNKLNIYYGGPSTITLGSGISIGGSFFAKESEIDMSDGGSGNTIAGNIISGGEKITIGGGNSIEGKYIIAPKAHVIFNQNFNGVIICDTFTASGDSQIKYAPGIVPPPFLPEFNPDYSDPADDMFEEKDLIEI